MSAIPPSQIRNDLTRPDLFATAMLGAWRAALPAAGSIDRGGRGLSVRAALYAPEQWRNLTAAHGPQRLARTVFAAILAIDSGVTDIGLVVGNDAGHPRIETLRVELDVPLTILAQRWQAWRTAADPHVARPYALHRLVEAAHLPAFYLEANDGGVSPLCCTVDGPHWAIVARAGITTASALAGLLEQIGAAIVVLAGMPAATTRHVAAGIRALAFNIAVLSDPAFTSHSVALSAWGHAVGIDTAVHRIDSEQIYGMSNEGSGFAPQPWGANLVVASQSLPSCIDPCSELAGILPDGRPIAQISSSETRELYDEIVVRNRYLRHGVQIDDGDLVVDVGANIGMFALFAGAQAAGVTIEAFEPAPEAAKLLQANMNAYGVTGTVHQLALGSHEHIASLIYYPRSSLQSGFHTDAAADHGIVRGYAREQARRRSGLAGEMPDEISAALAPVIADRIRQRSVVSVPVLRLSDWIRRQSVTAISLLKVDVERAEEDVLAGVEPHHWALIAQIVVEVHDVDGRVARVRSLLEHHGFDTVIEQDDLFIGSEIFMVYGRRPGMPRRQPSWLRTKIDLAVRWQQTSALPVYVTAPPAATIGNGTDMRLIRQATEAAGLPWIEPPPASDSSAPPLVWAETVLRQLTAPQRPVLKAIVVDADNTLWHGVCGEVGPNDVSVTGPYLAVQQFLAEQARAGRLLALCTRNNLEDVTAVFDAHPDMPLRLADFAVVHAGWGAKSEAVTAIASELGFAVDSLAYVDDSPAERAEVALAHPAMTVVHLPEDPDGYPQALHATWQLALDAAGTDEDRARTRMLAEETRRRDATGGTATVAEFIRQLDLDVDVKPASFGDAERLSQLAARTTQFNAMLRSHTPASVTRMISSGTLALSVRVRDRFGDYGLVGFAAGDADGEALRVRDFFLSCRALGRNVEWRMLQALAEHAADQGLKYLDLPCTPGPRNRPAMEFAAIARSRHPGPDGTHLLDATTVARLPWRAVGDRRAPADTRQAPAKPAVERPVSLRQPSWPVSPQTATAAAHLLRRHQVALTSPYTPPETALEKRIGQAWEQVLDMSPIGVHDDLFALGCDSVTAALICSRMRQDGLEVSFPDLLAHPTIRRTASRLQAPISTGQGTSGPPNESAGPVAASLGQQRVWAAEMIGGRGNAQTIPAAYRITGPLDVERLQEALTGVVRAHPALRTVLREQGGELIQQIADPVSVTVPVTDVSAVPQPERTAAADRAAELFFDQPFDLGRDVMVRARLVRWAREDHTLLTAVHHSAADGWSIDIISHELSRAYAEPNVPATDRPAAPFTAYCHNVDRRRRAGTYTARAGAVHAALPANATAWGSPSGLSVAARHHRSPLGQALTSAVASTARASATTPLTLHLAAYQLVLAAFTGAAAIVTGCPVANRDDPAFTSTVGFFANIVPIAAHFDWAGQLGDHLNGAVRRTTAALRHAAVPYGLLSERGGSPLFDNLFTLQPEPTHPLRLRGCAVTPTEPVSWPQPYPLMLDVQDAAGGATVLLRYDSHALHPVPPIHILTAYPLVLAALCTLPDLTMTRLRDLLRPGAAVADLIRDRLAHDRAGEGE